MATYVTPEQYDEIVGHLGRSRALREQARRPNLTLKQKLDLLERSRSASEQARHLGQEAA